MHVKVAPTLYQIEAQLRAALADATPRHATHNAFAPRPRVGWEAGVIPSGSRAAAALVLFYPVDEQVHLVLTRRAGTLGQHAGQVSLPGGALDQDESIEAAALREANEEIGLTDEVRVLGPLSPLYIPVSNFALYPVVAVADTHPHLTPADAEVERVLEVSLGELQHPDNRRVGWRWREGEAIRVPYFELQGERVWGATAMVLGELLAVLDAGAAATAPRDRSPHR